MEIPVSQLPSGGYGYAFPSIRLEPMTFIQITKYLENIPDSKDELGRYLYDIELLAEDDKNIKNCYIMDVDFLIFYKKLCTISKDLTYQIDIKCPECGKNIRYGVSLEQDIKFKQIDEKIMNGAKIKLGSNEYETIIPTVNDFMKVFKIYLKYRKIQDLKMIKTIALIKGFENNGNQIEDDVLNATHSDITLLMALRDLYYDRVEPIELYCSHCNSGKAPEERRSVAVSVDSLITDFFRELFINSPIDGTKILFK